MRHLDLRHPGFISGPHWTGRLHAVHLAYEVLKQVQHDVLLFTRLKFYNI